MRILLAEDDPSIAAVEAELLAAVGHSVTLASTPARARALARAQPWDVILADMFGASYRGVQPSDRRFLRAMSASGPVIVVSARSWVAHARPTELGVAAIVPKPFDPDDLLKAIRSARA